MSRCLEMKAYFERKDGGDVTEADMVIFITSYLSWITRQRTPLTDGFTLYQLRDDAEDD